MCTGGGREQGQEFEEIVVLQEWWSSCSCGGGTSPRAGLADLHGGSYIVRGGRLMALLSKELPNADPDRFITPDMPITTGPYSHSHLSPWCTVQKARTAVSSANPLIQNAMSEVNIPTSPVRLRVSTLVLQSSLKPNIHIQSAKPTRVMPPREYLPQLLSLGRCLQSCFRAYPVFGRTFITTMT